MKQLRIPVLAALVFFLALWIAGSFCDLSVSQALLVEKHPAGLFLAAFGVIPGYGIGAFMCGVLAEAIKNRRKTLTAKLFPGIAAAVFFLAAVYFSSKDVFSINGFYHPEYEKFSVLVSLPFMFLYAWFGYRCARGQGSRDVTAYAFIVIAAMLIVLVLGTVGIKSILHRPRYRIIIKGVTDFHPWWKKCADYKELMTAFGVTSEEFKSFPSGHTCAAALTMMFPVILPAFLKNRRKRMTGWFVTAFLYTLLVGFSRIVVGAHFLSDVGAGGLIGLAGIFAVNEIVTRRTEREGNIGVKGGSQR